MVRLVALTLANARILATLWDAGLDRSVLKADTLWLCTGMAGGGLNLAPGGILTQRLSALAGKPVLLMAAPRPVAYLAP